MIYTFLSFLIIFLLSGCSIFTQNNYNDLVFDSIPSGATVYDQDGKSIGVTPLKYDANNKICDENVTFVLSKEGFYSTAFHPNCQEGANLTAHLVKTNNLQFKLDTFGTYYKEMNNYTNKILQIQYKLSLS